MENMDVAAGEKQCLPFCQCFGGCTYFCQMVFNKINHAGITINPNEPNSILYGLVKIWNFAQDMDNIHLLNEKKAFYWC